METLSDALLAAVVCAETAMRTMLGFLWQDAGCAVIEAGDDSALVAHLRGRPLRQATLVGEAQEETLAALARWHARDAWLPLLLLTHSTDPHLRRRALALGVRDVIGLPATPRDLQARLRAALHPWRGECARRSAGATDGFPALAPPGELLRAGVSCCRRRRAR